MSKPKWGLLCGVLLTMSTNCSNSVGFDRCEEVADPCSEAGEIRCSADFLSIETCETNTQGCLVWTELEDCGEGRRCDSSGAIPTCLCNDTCAGVGLTQCAGRTIEVCSETEFGCLVWMLSVDCSDTDEGCSDSSGTPECVTGCGVECAPAHSDRCNGSLIERCAEDEDGCWIWEEVIDCLDTGEYCDDSGDEVNCIVDPCADPCSVVGDTRCVGTVIQLCEDHGGGCLTWVDHEDCEDLGLLCDEATGEATCTDSCADSCPADGASRCRGDIIQQCEIGPGGCLGWVDERDCETEGLSCGISGGGEAFCYCFDRCVASESRCLGDVVQHCEMMSGCMTWVDVVDCSTLGLSCVDTTLTAGCETGSGEDCTDTMVVWSFPFTLSGPNFGAVFNDDQSFTHPTCNARPGEPEVIFAIEALAGSTLVMTEYDEIDVLISVQSACDPAGPCQLSVDDFPWGGLRYDIPADGTYYVIVEESIYGGAAYEIFIDLIAPEECGDGLDNDRDGDVDCDDDDCFGDPLDCSNEVNCADGEDNDADGATDCDDADCVGTPDCEPYLGIYELFLEGNSVDLSYNSITFIPDVSASMGYRWTVTGGVTDFTEVPGSGTVSSTISLSDDDSSEYTFAELPSFEFYGALFSSLFVNSNGMITFDTGVHDYTPTVNEFFRMPVIAAYWTDLNPASGGTITVDDFTDRVAVTFEGVPRYGWSSPPPNHFQFVLSSTGSIELTFLSIHTVSSGNPTITGISRGFGILPHPPETDFVTPTPSP